MGGKLVGGEKKRKRRRDREIPSITLPERNLLHNKHCVIFFCRACCETKVLILQFTPNVYSILRIRIYYLT